jgi:hypothetical protein
VPDLPLVDRPDTVLPAIDPAARAALDAAMALDGDARREAVALVAAAHPSVVDAWSALAGVTDAPVARYAFARVGYHRGLDALRANGWGGVGRVRWVHPTNRGFLACLVRLRDAADAIGETSEVARIDAFLKDLDPDGHGAVSVDA